MLRFLWSFTSRGRGRPSSRRLLFVLTDFLSRDRGVHLSVEGTTYPAGAIPLEHDH